MRIKENFSSEANMMIYINKFIDRDTFLKRTCQICGKPAKIRHAGDDPYTIQLFCTECRRKLGLDSKHNKRNFVENVPTINLREYMTEESRKRKEKFILTDINKKIIESAKTTNLEKGAFLKENNITLLQYQRLVKLYKQIEPSIEEVLEKRFKDNRVLNIKTRFIKGTSIACTTNNLVKLKIERNLSNRDIEKLANHQIQSNALSLISTGKIEPKIKTKCILAKVFGVTVTDIFPLDEGLKDIHDYEEYLKLNMKLMILVKNYYSKLDSKDKMNSLSKQFGMKYNSRLYGFMNGNILLNNDEILTIKKLLKI